MSWNMDFTDIATEDIESGASVPPGWYRCVVVDVTDNPRLAGVMDFSFKVTHGPHKGAVIEDSLFPPDHAQTVEKSKKLKQRVAMYVTRLGLMSKEQLGGNCVELDLTEAVGKPCVIKAVEETYTRKEGGGTGSKIRPAFDGVYGPDDERVPDALRTGGSTAKVDAVTSAAKTEPGKPAAKPTAKKPAKKPADDFGDL